MKPMGGRGCCNSNSPCKGDSSPLQDPPRGLPAAQGMFSFGKLPARPAKPGDTIKVEGLLAPRASRAFARRLPLTFTKKPFATAPLRRDVFEFAPMEGSVFTFGDQINTDLIIPTPYLSPDEKEMGRHCFIHHAPAFAEAVRPGDMVAAGENFGCGSTKAAAGALLGAGIVCVIAKSFGRIFFRNAINAGLLVLECPAFVEAVRQGDRVRVDFESGTIENLTAGGVFRAPEQPPLIREIIRHGGILNLVKARRQTDAREGEGGGKP